MERPIETDLDRVRAVTANFFFWQGLRWVPLGVMLMVSALAPRSPALKPWVSIGMFVLLAVAGWLSVSVLGRYYAQAYGRVQGIAGQHARRTRIKWLIVYPIMTAALVLDWRLNLPVFLSGAAFAAGIEAYRRSTGGGRRHYLVAEVLLAALTLVPLVSAASSRSLLVPFIGILGAIYVVGGILDHLELTRIMKPVRMSEQSGSAL